MTDRQSLKHLDPDSQSFVALYDHPLHGQIDVGRISTRSLGNILHPWQWAIHCTLAPVYSPEQSAELGGGWPFFARARSRFLAFLA